MHPSLAGRARDWMRRLREIVIQRGWHREAGIGPVLRWLGRYVP